MKKVLLLGASGSIGSQTIDVIKKNRDSFSLVGISVGSRVFVLDEIISSFPECKYIWVKNETDLAYFKEKYPKINFYSKEDGLLELIDDSKADMVVNALLGFVGLAPSLHTLEKGKALCLANKESLVCGGALIKKALKENHGALWPIDSEHVAIKKCLHEAKGEIDKVILTASGGPFYFKDVDFSKVKKEDALKHPSWKMGEKITIDSSTLMNKGFEVIEAAELFGFSIDDIEVVIHPESYVHSGLKMKDGTYLLQVGKPDMRGPIEYALKEGDVSYSDVIKVNSLDELPYTFEEFSSKRFPAIDLCKKAYRMGGGALTIVNAVDEEVVRLFLDSKANYLDIVYSCQLALESISNIIEPSFIDLKEMDLKAREWVKREKEGK